MQEGVVEEHLVLVDADGRVTEDWALAVRGEVTETLADGTTRSTLFEVNRPEPGSPLADGGR